MSDLIGVSTNAVMAYQRALGTVSNNIANMATEGYSRQDVSLQASAPQKLGNNYIGTGVFFDQVKRQYDAFAESNLRNSNSDLESQTPMVNYANRVIDVIGSQTVGLVGALDRFFGSARQLSVDPASTVQRGAFMREAQTLTARFGELSAQLDLVDSETKEAMELGVGQVNTLSQQLARVNQQLGKAATLERQPSELLDQRDLLLRKLSQYSHINTAFKANGEVRVSLGNSISRDVIVDGTTATRVGVSLGGEPVKVTLVLDPYGNASPLNSVSSGQLAGLMAFREQVLGTTRSTLDVLASGLVREVNTIHQQGLDGYGRPAGALFSIDPKSATVAGGLSVALDDPMRIAAAAQFRVIKDANNPGGAQASISYDPAVPGLPALGQLVPPGSRVPLNGNSSYQFLGNISSGLKDAVVYLDGANAGQQLQLMTRDGRHLVGQGMDASLQAQLMTPENGLAEGASYSSAYLNQSGATGYRAMSVFYGARATVRQEPALDSSGAAKFDGNGQLITVDAQARLSGSRIASGQTVTLPAGALKLNGIALGALSPSGATLQATDIAAWINTLGAAGVTASASNEIRIQPSQIKLSLPLSLNGVTIAAPTTAGFGSVEGLIKAINDRGTGVQAGLSRTGELVLGNAAGQEGRDIVVGPSDMAGIPANALYLTAGAYTGSVQLQRSLVSGQNTSIELSFGEGGNPADLAKLGFRTGAYLSGTVPDDVLVFVTGSGAASVAANTSGSPTDRTPGLRAQSLQLVFTASDRYTITDTKTGTVLAERKFDSAQISAGIRYQGLNIKLTTAPQAGDRFVLDGNRDGTGNNDNMLRLAALESARLVAGSKTLAAAYIDHVNDIGNISRQAAVAQEALSVVHTQAVETREKISGVSLDEEAANLIRFQQAYQASAKVMQVAGTLFDAVLQVR